MLVELDKGDVLAAIMPHMTELEACTAEEGKRSPGSQGHVVMRWTVLPSGVVSEVAVATPNGPAELVTCFGAALRTVRFPVHEKQGAPIEFPFTYSFAPSVEPVREELMQGDILEGVAAHLNELGECAGRSRRERGARGRVVMQWTILPSGVVDAVGEVSGDDPDEVVECFVATIRTWRFPAHQKPGEPVTFPFKY
ncbi:MAG: AgmX/PglI C-terminal domain-containing protein [Myxococcales bacterium]|nr:AgmX/PglI C-terminal domain-containing protein [Myxococcales bacterium]